MARESKTAHAKQDLMSKSALLRPFLDVNTPELILPSNVEPLIEYMLFKIPHGFPYVISCLSRRV